MDRQPLMALTTTSAGPSPVQRPPAPRPLRLIGRAGIRCRVRVALVAFCAGLSAAACDLADGYTSLGTEFFVPDVAYVNIPGTVVAEGRYNDLRVQVAGDGQRYVSALKEGSTLTFSFFDETPQCTVGPVVAHQNATEPAPGFETEVLPFLQREEDQTTTLHFTNKSCDVSDVAVSNTDLPLLDLHGVAPGNSTGFLVRTATNELLFVDPWNEEVREVATEVTRLQLESDLLVTIEGGQLVLRDLTLQEIGRAGAAVQHFVVNATKDEIAFTEGGVLYVAALGALEDAGEVAADVCGVNYALAGGNSRLSFFSPCEDRTLVVMRPNGEDRVEYVSGVNTTPRLTLSDSELHVVYVTDGETSSTGKMWLRVGEEEPTLVSESADLTTLTLSPTRLLFTENAVNGAGDYVSWQDGERTEIASGVVEINSLGLLANFDGTTGDLLRIKADDSTELLASGVPLRARRGDGFIANFEDGVGDLMLLENGQPPPKKIASGVGTSAFGFSVQFDGMIYLHDRDPENGTSTLSVLLIETGDTFKVNKGVTESREVAFPKPGILYSVQAGETPGIWFASAR